MYDNNFLDEFRHPSTKILGSRTNRLEGKTIVLGVTGSIAAFLSPQIARELIREGATVIPVLSKDGAQLVGKNLLWWATGVEPIMEVTGRLEHIYLAGVMNKPADLMLIAPCTTNTVAKISAGIADTPVTLIASTFLGKGIPLQILTVGHEDLYNSPTVMEATDKLKSRGVTFIEPNQQEGKAKVPPIDDVIFQVLQILTPKLLRDRKVVITGGPTREYIDNVRFITNGASGKSAMALAREAMLHGADVKLIIGDVQTTIPSYLRPIKVESSNEMQERTLKEIENVDKPIVILTAAMADFMPDKMKEGKTKSNQSFDVKLIPTEKLSDFIKTKNNSSIFVVYKAEWGVSREVLIERAMKKMKEVDADFAIANDLSEEGAGFGTDTNHVLLVRPDGKVRYMKGLKTYIAYEIVIHLYKKYVKMM
jgi:phosphopantothenoylcysteine decarboxylase / phosphopantothenate---cysteine ligase